MKTLKTLSIAGIGSIALTLMTPAISVAEIDQTAKSSNGHSLVHRVSHSLASSKSYGHSATSGYKWGKKSAATESTQQWAESSERSSGYKWGNSTPAKSEAQSYAKSGYQWGTMNFSEQAGYRWGMKSFSDQSGYRWGMKSFSDQSGYRWGMKSFSDQSGYRWGMKSFSGQSGYRWGMKHYTGAAY